MAAHFARLRGAVVVAMLCLAGWPAAAQEALYVRTLAANCAQCHGTDGRPVAGSAVPAIAGRPREELAAQLKAFKAGTRSSTIMQQLARGYTDAQLDRLAAYFAAQGRP